MYTVLYSKNIGHYLVCHVNATSYDEADYYFEQMFPNYSVLGIYEGQHDLLTTTEKWVKE